VGVTVCRLDFKDAVFNSEQGHIESASTEIKDEYILFTLTGLVKTIGDSGGSRLVNDTLNVEASNGAGVLGSLALGIVEVSRDGDDGRRDGLSEVSLCNFLHLDKDHRGDLLSLILLGFAFELNDDHWLFVGTGLDLEGPKGDIFLDSLV
jgi:hypothetical protein